MNQNLSVNKTNFRMKGFALGLAQRRNATRKSPIDVVEARRTRPKRLMGRHAGAIWKRVTSSCWLKLVEATNSSSEVLTISSRYDGKHYFTLFQSDYQSYPIDLFALALEGSELSTFKK